MSNPTVNLVAANAARDATTSIAGRRVAGLGLGRRIEGDVRGRRDIRVVGVHRRRNEGVMMTMTVGIVALDAALGRAVRGVVTARLFGAEGVHRREGRGGVRGGERRRVVNDVVRRPEASVGGRLREVSEGELHREERRTTRRLEGRDELVRRNKPGEVVSEARNDAGEVGNEVTRREGRVGIVVVNEMQRRRVLHPIKIKQGCPVDVVRVVLRRNAATVAGVPACPTGLTCPCPNWRKMT